MNYIELECESCGDVFGYMIPVKGHLLVYSVAYCEGCYEPDAEDDGE